MTHLVGSQHRWPHKGDPTGAKQPSPPPPLIDVSGEDVRDIGDSMTAAAKGYKTLCAHCRAAYKPALTSGTPCAHCRSEGSLRQIRPDGLVVALPSS